eukprot:2671558-Prorocentrum_lima.AAC.1
MAVDREGVGGAEKPGEAPLGRAYGPNPAVSCGRTGEENKPPTAPASAQDGAGAGAEPRLPDWGKVGEANSS